MRRAKRLLIVGCETHYAREVLRGILHYCRTHGQWEFHLVGDNSPEAVKEAQAGIRTWKADGIIAHIRSTRVERLVRDSGAFAVNVSSVRQLPMPTVILDHFAIGRMAAQFFLNCGFRNFAYYVDWGAYTHKRYLGFVTTVQEAGCPCAVFNPRGPAVDWATFLPRIGRWLRSLKKPVALMCYNDIAAQTLIWACRRSRLAIPDDVAMLGAGNQESLCQMCLPPLSSVDPDIHRVGYEAAKLLHAMIRGAQPPTEPILIPPARVVTRHSSEIVIVDDADVAAALRYLRDHALEPITVKDVLREVPISRRTMERRFEKLLGHMPAEEIARLRLNHAKTQLEKTDLSIAAVARESGFMRRVIFTEFFRRRMNLTPTQYRRRCSSSMR